MNSYLRHTESTPSGGWLQCICCHLFSGQIKESNCKHAYCSSHRCHCGKEEQQKRCSHSSPWSCRLSCGRKMPCGHTCREVNPPLLLPFLFSPNFFPPDILSYILKSLGGSCPSGHHISAESCMTTTHHVMCLSQDPPRGSSVICRMHLISHPLPCFCLQKVYSREAFRAI